MPYDFSVLEDNPSRREPPHNAVVGMWNACLLYAVAAVILAIVMAISMFMGTMR